MTDEDAKRVADVLEKLARTAAKIEDVLKVGGVLDPDDRTREEEPFPMRLTTSLTKARRMARDVEVVERTLQRWDVGYVESRAKNRLVGRALARTGSFKALLGAWGRR